MKYPYNLTDSFFDNIIEKSGKDLDGKWSQPLLPHYGIRRNKEEIEELMMEEPTETLSICELNPIVVIPLEEEKVTLPI